MTTFLLGVSFVCLWAGTTLLLSCLAGLQRKVSLTDRLRPYVDGDDWTTDVEAFLKEQYAGDRRRGDLK